MPTHEIDGNKEEDAAVRKLNRAYHKAHPYRPLGGMTWFTADVDSGVTEAELVTGLRAREDSATEEVWRRYKDEIYARVRAKARSQEDSEDILCDVKIAILKGAPKFEGRSKIKTWVYRVTKNATVSFYRGKANRYGDTNPKDGSLDISLDAPIGGGLERPYFSEDDHPVDSHETLPADTVHVLADNEERLDRALSLKRVTAQWSDDELEAAALDCWEMRMRDSEIENRLLITHGKLRYIKARIHSRLERGESAEPESARTYWCSDREARTIYYWQWGLRHRFVTPRGASTYRPGLNRGAEPTDTRVDDWWRLLGFPDGVGRFDWLPSGAHCVPLGHAGRIVKKGKNAVVLPLSDRRDMQFEWFFNFFNVHGENLIQEGYRERAGWR